MLWSKISLGRLDVLPISLALPRAEVHQTTPAPGQPLLSYLSIDHFPSIQLTMRRCERPASPPYHGSRMSYVAERFRGQREGPVCFWRCSESSWPTTSSTTISSLLTQPLAYHHSLTDRIHVILYPDTPLPFAPAPHFALGKRDFKLNLPNVFFQALVFCALSILSILPLESHIVALLLSPSKFYFPHHTHPLLSLYMD